MAGILFEDIFDVKDIDPEGKKFDRGKVCRGGMREEANTCPPTPGGPPHPLGTSLRKQGFGFFFSVNEKLETAFSIIFAVPVAWVALSHGAGTPLGTFLTPYTVITCCTVRLARTLNFIL